MNKAYVGIEEIIFFESLEGWFDKDKSIVLVENVYRFPYPGGGTRTQKYLVKIDFSGDIENGVKYKVIWVLNYFEELIKDKAALIHISGKSVDNYFGPRDMFIFKNNSEKLWEDGVKFDFNWMDMDIAIMFKATKGFTRGETVDKNGETTHYNISISINNFETIDVLVSTVTKIHEMLFGFQWLEDSKIRINTLSILEYNKKPTLLDKQITTSLSKYLGDIYKYKDFNFALFMSTYNFIKLYRDNNVFEINIQTISSISELLFDSYYIDKFKNGKKINDLSKKIERVLPNKIKGDNYDIKNFIAARTKIIHSKHTSIDRNTTTEIIEGIIYIWCYWMSNKNPSYFARRFFRLHEYPKNNYDLYSAQDTRLKNLKDINSINYIVSTLMDFEKTDLWVDVYKLFEKSGVDSYIFPGDIGSGKLCKVPLWPEAKQRLFLLQIEQDRTDYIGKRQQPQIYYDALLQQSKRNRRLIEKFLKDVSLLVKPKI